MTYPIEFSRPLSVQGVGVNNIRTEIITATAEECQNLCARLGVSALSDVKASLKIHRLDSSENNVRIEGHFTANITQPCVISLQDVHSHVDATFEAFFSDTGVDENDPDYEYDPEDDRPEKIIDDTIDLGELVTQYLSLEIDPYPRAEGVEDLEVLNIIPEEKAPAEDKKTHRPFQVLQGLADQMKDKKKAE